MVMIVINQFRRNLIFHETINIRNSQSTLSMKTL